MQYSFSTSSKRCNSLYFHSCDSCMNLVFVVYNWICVNKTHQQKANVQENRRTEKPIYRPNNMSFQCTNKQKHLIILAHKTFTFCTFNSRTETWTNLQIWYNYPHILLVFVFLLILFSIICRNIFCVCVYDRYRVSIVR